MYEDRGKASLLKDDSEETLERSIMDDKLYEAARLKDTDFSDILATKGSEFFKTKTRGPENNNMLHVAAQHGNAGFIKATIDKLSCYDLLCEQNSKEETPLHLAAEFGHKKTVQALLDAQDHNAYNLPCWKVTDNKGDTPLHKALRYGHQDIAILLFQRDPDLVILDNHAGESPAYLAAKSLCERFFHTILANQSSISFSGPFGMTTFHAARNLNDDIMLALIERKEDLLTHQDDKGKTVLHYVVEENIEPMVEILLRANSSLGCLHDNDGMTPLHIASRLGSFPMVRVILELSPQSLLMLCDEGKTALHVAKMDPCFLRVCLGHTRMKELINVADNEGNTPLHLALKHNSHNLDIADALLEVGGINWRLENSRGFTPLDLYKSNKQTTSSKLVFEPEVGDINRKLEDIDCYTCMDSCKLDDKIPSNLEWLTSENWRVKDEVNMKALYGVQGFGVYLDNMLKSEEIDWEELFTSYRGAEGESIVHVAAREGHMGIINKAANEWDCKSRVLVLCGENWKGETPLHVAAASGELEVVEAILQLCISTDKLGNNKSQQQQDEEQLRVVIEPTHMPYQHHKNKNKNKNNGLEWRSTWRMSHSEWRPWISKSTNGDTPIHMALRNGHDQVAACLLDWDPNLISTSVNHHNATSVNKANESLLYLAALTNCRGSIRRLLSSDAYVLNRLNCTGPHGRNALHAAISHLQTTSTMGFDQPSFDFDKPKHIQSAGVGSESNYSKHTLIWKLGHLINKADNNGKTPLMYAVELGLHDEATTMLDKDASAAFMYDNEGFTPLLRVAANGYARCTQDILVRCPHSVELRHARSGRTILHLSKLPGDVLKECMNDHPVIAKFINEIDRDGNTPLHCAILDSDVVKARLLLSIKGVKLGIRNKQNLTPMELCTKRRLMGGSKQLAISIVLEDAQAREEKRSSNVPLLLRMNVGVLANSDQLIQRDEELKQLLENVAVAAALLITLTFAATFTIPGGFDGETGQALRMKEASVKVFIASDVVAMLLGVGVLLTYTFGTTKRAWLRVLAIPCVVMLQCALLATIVAFISGVYAVVSQDAKWIAILAFTIVGGVFLMFSITPASANVVIRMQKWLRQAAKFLLAVLLIMPYYLAQVFGKGDYIERIIYRLAPPIGLRI